MTTLRKLFSTALLGTSLLFGQFTTLPDTGGAPGSGSIALTTSVLKGDNAGAGIAATAGTDFSKPNTTETTSGDRTFTGAVDASGATTTAPLKSGTATPGTCSPPQMFFETDATAGANIWLCTSANVWTQVSGVGGGATITGADGDVVQKSGSNGVTRSWPEFDDNGTQRLHAPAFIVGPNDDTTFTGKHYYPASSTQSITAVGNTVLCNRVSVAVSPTSALTLTSAPTIADGTDGQKCTIINVGTFNLVLQDQDTLASSNLQLASSTVTIPPKGQLTLQYNSTIGDWVQDGVGGSGTSSGTYTSWTHIALGVNSANAVTHDSRINLGAGWAHGGPTTIGSTRMHGYWTLTDEATTNTATISGYMGGTAITNMKVRIAYTGTTFNTGSGGDIAWRIGNGCQAEEGSIASITFSTPAFTIFTPSDNSGNNNLKRYMEFDNVLSGAGCGLTDHWWIKLEKGLLADGDTSPSTLKIHSIDLGITRNIE